jgi:hypothetical protein
MSILVDVMLVATITSENRQDFTTAPVNTVSLTPSATGKINM